MSRPVRSAILVIHVAVSVGWLGAVLAFLPLAISGRASPEPETVRGAYLAMHMIGTYVVAPLALASLLSGLVQGLTSHWGVIRHYWVSIKLLITLIASAVFLVYLQTLGYMADTADASRATGALPELLRSPTVLLHTTLAALALLVATVLSIFKPHGLTPYGLRKRREGEPPGGPEPARTPAWVRTFAIAAVVLTLLLALGLAVGGGHGPGRHLPASGETPAQGGR